MKCARCCKERIVTVGIGGDRKSKQADFYLCVACYVEGLKTKEQTDDSGNVT